ncbi:MAG: type II toxin-antitoxin system VapC family toxin [bacterium]|nr:type II toxin-antitoxin system VapC family toxin [bacterium]
MTDYLLDTNTLTVLETPDSPAYRLLMETLTSLSNDTEVYFSILSAYEYQHGISKASQPLSEKLKKTWQTISELFDVLPLSTRGAEIYGDIKSKYQTSTGIGKNEIKRHTIDFIIAATALEFEVVLVSRDKIFKKIQGFYPTLKVESWI